MFKLKKLLASLLVLSLILSNSLPSLAESFSKEENETSITSEVVSKYVEEPSLEFEETEKVEILDDVEEEIEDEKAKEEEYEEEKEKDSELEIEDLKKEKAEEKIFSNNNFNCNLTFVDAFNAKDYLEWGLKEGTNISVSTYNIYLRSQNSNAFENRYFLTWTEEYGNIYKDGDTFLVERSQEFLIDYTYARRIIIGLPTNANIDINSIEGAYLYEDRILYAEPDKNVILPIGEQMDLHNDKLEFGFWSDDNENDYSRIKIVYTGTQDVEVYGLLRAIPEEEIGPYDLTMPADWFKYPLYSQSGEFIHKAFITKVTFDDSDSIYRKEIQCQC